MIKAGCLLSPPGLSPSVNIPIRPQLPKKYVTPAQCPIQDQGSTSMCVAYSLMELLTYRGKLTNHRPNVTVNDIYKSRRDKTTEGMNVVEGLNFLKERNIIRTFGKITIIGALQSALIANGPAVLVLPVYSSDTEFWKDTGRLLGYHAITVVGFEPGYYRLKNSWGASYGSNGYSEISADDLTRYTKEIWTIIN